MPIPIQDILVILKEANSSSLEVKTLTQLALRAGWSKYHFLREFQRYTGETPKQYLQRVRIERAAATLISSSKNIMDIAIESEFGSHEVFIRAFKKRFGCSPLVYRNKVPDFKNQNSSQIKELVHVISPCIGLYYLDKSPNRRRNTMKSLQIERINLDSQPILYIQKRLDPKQLQENMSEAFGKLFGYGMQNNLPITGQPIARYVSLGPGLWTVDFVMPLAAEVEGTGDMKSGFLEDGEVLKAAHFGPYESLQESYLVIEKWMESEGVAPRGSNWEQYVTSPGEEPDVSKWQTNIFWPVK